MTDPLDINCESAQEVKQCSCAWREQEDHDEGRRHRAQHLVQQQREAVRVQRLELREHGARVASASPLLGHVMRVQREGLEQSIGLHGHEAIRGLSTTLPKPIEGARHGKHCREQR